MELLHAIILLIGSIALVIPCQAQIPCSQVNLALWSFDNSSALQYAGTKVTLELFYRNGTRVPHIAGGATLLGVQEFNRSALIQCYEPNTFQASNPGAQTLRTIAVADLMCTTMMDSFMVGDASLHVVSLRMESSLYPGFALVYNVTTADRDVNFTTTIPNNNITGLVRYEAENAFASFSGPC